MDQSRYNQGFTLVETLIAILILSMTIGALMTLAANGFFNVRYARNDIVATNLAQEALEFVRNNRDTSLQQVSLPAGGISWDAWKASYGAPGSLCFSEDGCMINTFPGDDLDTGIIACNGGCDPLLYFTESNLYGYIPSMLHPSSDTSDVITTTFVRTVLMKESSDGSQVVVTARMDWKNGTNPKHTTQSIIVTNLFNE